jgi:hypothetical protein
LASYQAQCLAPRAKTSRRDHACKVVVGGGLSVVMMLCLCC